MNTVTDIAVAREANAPTSPWPAFFVASIAVFLVSIDGTVLFAAFGALRDGFPDSSAADLSWVLNAYTVVYAALLVPAGRLSDALGRKRVFQLGLLLFLAASAACGAAPTVSILVAARVLQANLLEIEWGAAPYPPTTQAMFQQAAESFTAERQDSRAKDEGDVEAVLKAADTKSVLQAEYRVPYLAHAPLEPMNAVVLLKDGRLDVWTGPQIPGFTVIALAALTGLAEDSIHLHVQIMGGSFGRRLEDDFVRQAVELAQAHQGVPIKMTWTREEDMTHDYPRPLFMARARGLVASGQVQAYDLGIAAASVSASQFGRLNVPMPGPDIWIVAGAWDQPFAIPNYRVTGYRVPEMVPVSSWRSVGASANGFLHECFLDELIHAAGADPLAERIRLCSHEPSKRVLQAVGEMSGWGKPLPKGSGRGLAFTLSFGVPVAEVVEVTATPNGIRIDKAFVVAEVGQVLDPVNVEAQLTGGVIWGLSHAMLNELTYADGAAEQTNFHDYPSLRLYQAPQVVAKALQTTGRIKGIGEPGVPPAAPALANAIFAATGQRIRELPLRKHIAFV